MAFSLLCVESTSSSTWIEDITDFQINAYLDCQTRLEIRFVLQFAKTPNLASLS